MATRRFCRALCERLGVPLTLERVDAARRRQPPGRTRATPATRSPSGSPSGDYAAAHTASDQAETVLYRLAVSPGRRALLGMAARRGRLVRPLLGRHARGGARLPARPRPRLARGPLQRRPPLRARPRAPRRARRPARAEPRSGAHDRGDRAPAARGGRAAGAAAGDARRSRGDLAGFGPPARQVAARGAAGDPLRSSDWSSAVSPRRRQACRAPSLASDADAILALGDAGTHALDLGGGLRAVAEYGLLRFTRVRDDPRARAGRAAGARPRALRRLGRRGACSTARGEVDGGARSGPSATVRAWRDGDRMRPLGLGGIKSLQDLFTDRKVPRALRHTLPVVESGGEIVWVAGVALDERFASEPGGPGAVGLVAACRPRHA